MKLTNFFLLIFGFGIANCIDIKMVAPYEPGNNGAEPCLRICVGTTGKGMILAF